MRCETITRFVRRLAAEKLPKMEDLEILINTGRVVEIPVGYFLDAKAAAIKVVGILVEQCDLPEDRANCINQSAFATS